MATWNYTTHVGHDCTNRKAQFLCVVGPTSCETCSNEEDSSKGADTSGHQEMHMHELRERATCLSIIFQRRANQVLPARQHWASLKASPTGNDPTDGVRGPLSQRWR